jgi:xanthine dehydrogenase YagS FAD-binding subunit
MRPIGWVDPDDAKAALAEGAKAGSLYKAGGIDLIDRLKEGLQEPGGPPLQLVNLRRPALEKELGQLRQEKGALLLGPLLTLSRLAADEQVVRQARALALAAGQAATPQVRAAATLGGNLCQRPRCWYLRSDLFHCRRKGGQHCFAIPGEHEQHAVFDNEVCAVVHPSATGCALLALGARLHLRSAGGERTVAIDDFFVSSAQDPTRENVLRAGELISEVRVTARAHSGYEKIVQKQSFDWPLAEAAVALELEGREVREARVVLGHAAPTPLRAKKAEQFLLGRALDSASAAEAARLAVGGATPLARNAYKLPLLEAAVKRALLSAVEGA